MSARRVLLAVPATLLLIGAVTHLRAFDTAAGAVAASNLPAFFGSSLKALWVMDACGMFVLAAVCVVWMIDPRTASPLVMALLSLIPLSTAALLYVFIGTGFFAGHLLIVAGVAIAGAAAADRLMLYRNTSAPPIVQ